MTFSKVVSINWYSLHTRYFFFSYAAGISREWTELVVIAVSHINGPVLIRNAIVGSVHHNGDTFVQIAGTDISEGVRKTERSGLNHGPGNASFFNPIKSITIS